jgi:hypothetical protein
VAAVLFWRSTGTPALASRDTVVLASFVNRTGDPMFDDTLGEALGVQLRQSPFLNVLNEMQQQSTLRQMGRDPASPVTIEIGEEVCQRNAGKAVLGGSIASVGSSYLMTLAARDCVTGEVLAEEQVQPSSKDEVLGALGRAASNFRERLGESLASARCAEAVQPGCARPADAGRPRLGAVLRGCHPQGPELRARLRAARDRLLQHRSPQRSGGNDPEGV